MKFKHSKYIQILGPLLWRIFKRPGITRWNITLLINDYILKFITAYKIRKYCTIIKSQMIEYVFLYTHKFLKSETRFVQVKFYVARQST